MTLGPWRVLFVDSDVCPPWRVELSLKVFVGDRRHFTSCMAGDVDDCILGGSVCNFHLFP